MAELVEAAEAIEEVAKEVRGIPVKFVVPGVVAGFVGGFLVGGWVTNKRLRLKYEQIAEEEIDEMREHFRKRLLVKEEKPDLSSKAAEIVQREGYDGPATPLLEEDEDEGIPPEEEELSEDESPDGPVVSEEEDVEDPVQKVKNVFEGKGWDYEAEIALRRPEFPYIIHVDERYDKEGYTHTELIYYEGDGVLTDQDNKPVEEIDKVVGIANLEKFGHGSGNKDALFIRNDALELEVEVERDKGSFSEVVHGIKHSADPPRRRRVRFDDDDSS